MRNPHAEKRLAIARRIFDAYPTGASPDAFAVAGSVGAGLADRFSDLEVDCYWKQAPSDANRLAPISALGADLTTLWPYDEADQEFSEDYVLDGLDVTISNFTCASVDAMIAHMQASGTIADVTQYRFAALTRSRVLSGGDTVEAWRQRIEPMPDQVVASIVEHELSPHSLPGWNARTALVERGDVIAVRGLLASVGRAVFHAVLAANRFYRPHRIAKWQYSLLGECALLPERFDEDLDGLWGTDVSVALSHAERLVLNTLALTEGVLGGDLPGIRAGLESQRNDRE